MRLKNLLRTIIMWCTRLKHGPIIVEVHRDYETDVDLMRQDCFSMGTRLSKEITMLHSMHPTDTMVTGRTFVPYMILVHEPTGKSIRITLEQESTNDS